MHFPNRHICPQTQVSPSPPNRYFLVFEKLHELFHVAAGQQKLWILYLWLTPCAISPNCWWCHARVFLWNKPAQGLAWFWPPCKQPHMTWSYHSQSIITLHRAAASSCCSSLRPSSMAWDRAFRSFSSASIAAAYSAWPTNTQTLKLSFTEIHLTSCSSLSTRALPLSQQFL